VDIEHTTEADRPASARHVSLSRAGRRGRAQRAASSEDRAVRQVSLPDSHGIVAGKKNKGFETHDVDFLLGHNFLVTVHQYHSRSIEEEQRVLERHGSLLAEGTCALLHRIIDRMVDHYGPEVDGLEDRLDALEQRVFSGGRTSPLRDILGLKSDIASLRRVVLPQRDVVSRLARREFIQISDALSYRFRDVHDHLVRLADEAIFLQDRVTGLLDGYISTQSHKLNQVMKVLTVIATIFMPLTVLTSMYGMNVQLPHLPGGEGAQFWWILGIMSACPPDALGLPAHGLAVNRIHRLPPELANQIAAGEVVERPASVVKELVENAVDAGAHRIAITVEFGGKKLIAVEDDGEGMSAEDAVLAVERHATSKIRSASDLGAIATLGFRGEALPSIASVSRFRLRTRLHANPTGTELRIEAGKLVSSGEVGAPVGTLVEVADLFYNLPARRKFLKADTAETAQISRLVTQLALGYCDVGFVLRAARASCSRRHPARSLEERLLSGVWRPAGSRAGVEAGRRHYRIRLHRRARRAGAGARASARLRQSAHRPRPHDSRMRSSRATASRQSRNAARKYICSSNSVRTESM
jgi:magnesium/cobalt transport protein CorA